MIKRIYIIGKNNKNKFLHISKNINIVPDHQTAWSAISRSKEGSAMIVEDTAYPVDNFISLLEEYSKELPQKWDMLYLGCTGSCSDSHVVKLIHRIINNKQNENVVKNGKKMIYTFTPGYPLGLYGYVLSHGGAKKLVANKELMKIKKRIDIYLIEKVFANGGFNISAFNPPLIFNNMQNRLHELIKPLLSDQLCTEGAIYIRNQNITISYITLIVAIFAFLVGKFGSIKNSRLLISILTFIQLVELGFTKGDKTKTKTLILELCIVYIAYFIGIYTN